MELQCILSGATQLKTLFIWLHWVLVATHTIFSLRCDMWILQLWHMNSQLQHVGSSSLTRDQTQCPLHWEHGILAIVPPRKSQKLHDVAAAAAKSLQSCPTLCNPIDSSPPGSPVGGILQARILEWVAISFSIHDVDVVSTGDANLDWFFKVISARFLQHKVTVFSLCN